MKDVNKIREFLQTVDNNSSGSGSGFGYGSGYGYGDGSGYGYGSGLGLGSGLGYGDGSGYGEEISMFCGKQVHMIDGICTIVDSVNGNVARGRALKADLTTEPCYVVKQDGTFAIQIIPCTEEAVRCIQGVKE